MFCWSSANTEIGLINATTTFATNTNAALYTRAKPSTSIETKDVGLLGQEKKRAKTSEREKERTRMKA